jgi:aspartate aminotransferase
MFHYTVFVDGISKAFAATGVRVGWSFGPALFIDKMKAILSHIGAWAPKAEQVATAKYLTNNTSTTQFIGSIKERVEKRLLKFHQGFQNLKSQGFMVDSIAPQGAIYLTVKFALHKKTTSDGQVLHSTKEVTKYLLEEAKLAIVPFYAFGSSTDSEWYRLSVGTCDYNEIDSVMDLLKNALQKLS